jgi:hypothetical protein
MNCSIAMVFSILSAARPRPYPPIYVAQIPLPAQEPRSGGKAAGKGPLIQGFNTWKAVQKGAVDLENVVLI